MTTIDALVEALEKAAHRFDLLSLHSDVERNGARPSTGAAEARAAIAQARAEQAEPVESVCATCGALRVDPVLNVAAPAPKLEPCGVVESAVRGCEGYHVRVWPGQPAPRVGAELYTHPPAAPVAKLEPLTDAEKRELAGNYFAEDWAQEKAIGLMDDFEAAHNAKLTGIKSST